MGGNSSSTPQYNMGSQLSSLFMGNTGYQPMQGQAQLPAIQAPQYGPALNPSPEQAAAATRARMLARTPAPMAAPAAAPKKAEVWRGNGGPGSGRGGN